MLRWDAGADRRLTSWEQAAVAGDVPPVTVVETHATSADGTPVHMFVLSGRGAAGPPRPTVLYGYGGFNVALTPAYSAQALAWVEAGGVYAVANLRGGCEEGEEWHRAGMRERKQNVFDDFHAAAEHLVADGWTTHGSWRSAAARTAACWSARRSPSGPTWPPPWSAPRRCWTWSATSGSGSGRTWNDEYGTADDPTELGWLLGYSPYHRGPRGHGLPGGAVHGVRVRHPRRPAARPQAGRRAAARDDVRRARSCCAGRRRSGTARGR